MCEYCNLLSGDRADIGYARQQTLFMERHNNTFSITTELEHSYEEDEIDINYCPICGRKLREEHKR